MWTCEIDFIKVQIYLKEKVLKPFDRAPALVARTKEDHENMYIAQKYSRPCTLLKRRNNRTGRTDCGI